MPKSTHNKTSEWVISKEALERNSPPLVGILRASNLLNELEQYSNFTFPSPVPLIWLNFLKSIIENHLEYLKFLKTQIEKTRSSQDLITRLNTARLIVDSLDEFRSFIRFIVTAETLGTVYELTSPIEELVASLSQKTSLILRPQWQYNFTYRNFSRDYLLPLFCRIPTNDLQLFINLATKSEIKGNELPHMAVISFAGLERKNALAQVVLGHEIGHLLDDAFHVYENCDIENLISNESETLKKIIRKHLGNIKESIEIANEIDKLQENACFWVRELIADMIAIRLLGPAYIFGLHNILFAVSTYEELPPEHPTLHERLRWTLNESKELGYIKFFEEHSNRERISKVISNYIKQLRKIPTKDFGDRKVVLLKRITYRATTAARNFIHKNVIPDDKCYCLDKEIFEQVRYLSKEIPPNQRCIVGITDTSHRRPPFFEFRSILNTGWIFYLTHKKKTIPSLNGLKRVGIYDPEHLQLRIVSDLVLLAIKLGSFHKHYLERKEKLKNESN